ncbi:MAG TPA: ester cyclase [Dehalococcoidia bacterium]|jgi:steroid delta-isomerase-like uncharacterized protein
MSTETNKDTVREFVKRVFVKLDAHAVEELVTDDFVSHAWRTNPGQNAKESLVDATKRMSSALSDIKFTIDDLIAEGDRVVARLTAGARQTGEFMGLPPSGKSYKVGEIHIFRLTDGKIAEHWLEMDAMGLMQQLKGD